MLVYHPAFDPYHCIFRALLLLENHPEKQMPVDTLRIVDFYLLFPHLLANLDFPRGAGVRGRALAGQANRFNALPSPRLFFSQIKGIHSLVLDALAGKNLIEQEDLRHGIVRRTDVSVPSPLLSAAQARDLELAQYLATRIAVVPIAGKSGLRARSNLMEHRYDPA